MVADSLWRDAHPACELAVLATRPGPLPDAARLRDVVARIGDWEQCRRLAVDHGVAGLVHRRLGTLIAERCPPDAWRRWGEECRTTSLEGFAGVSELVRIVRELEREQLPVLAVKGPVLGLSLYGDVGLRPFGDLDLVVHPDDRNRAINRLYALSFVPTFPLIGAAGRRYVRRYGELHLVHARTGTVVDLHWELLSRRYGFGTALDGCWDRTTTVPIGATDVRTLGADDLLVHLLIHAAKHEWRCLGWLGDIARVTQQQGAVDGERIARTAGRTGSSRLVATGLEISALLLGVPSREWLAAAGLSASCNSALAREVAGRLLRSPEVDQPHLTRPWPTLPWRRICFRALERPSDRLRWVRKVLLDPTPLEWQAVPLPPALDWLYPLVRAGRLLHKHGWQPARLSLAGRTRRARSESSAQDLVAARTGARTERSSTTES